MAGLPALTPMQQAVFNGLAAGERYTDIAARLGISVQACRSHSSAGAQRIGARTVYHAVAILTRECREDDIVMTPGLRAYLRRFEKAREASDLLLDHLAA